VLRLYAKKAGNYAHSQAAAAAAAAVTSAKHHVPSWFDKNKARAYMGVKVHAGKRELQRAEKREAAA
jgi:hypothetical protein